MPKEVVSIFLTEAAAISVLLFTFLSLYRSNRERYFRLWVVGWVFLLAYVVTLLADFFFPHPLLVFLARANYYTATIFFAAAVLSYMDYARLLGSLPPLWIAGTLLILLRATPSSLSGIAGFLASALSSAIYFSSGFLFRHHFRDRAGLGGRILSYALIFHGLHVLDRPTWGWMAYPLLPLTIDSLIELMLGIGMVVLVLEESRARTEELNRKLRVLNTITSQATQYMNIERMLGAVLDPVIEMLDMKLGIVRVLEGPAGGERLRLRAQRGFSEEFLRTRAEIPLDDPIARNVIGLAAPLVINARDPGWETVGQIMAREQVQAMVLVPLRGKERVLGMLGIADRRQRVVRSDELEFLVGVANELGVIVENAQLFEQVASAHRQWVYTFDSLTDYILVHDRNYRVMKTNRALAHRLGAAPIDLVGRRVREIYFGRSNGWQDCPFCERLGEGGSGEMYESSLGGYVLVTTSAFLDPAGAPLGTIHVAKDINDRKLAEEKYKTLFDNVEEGLFISTPEGKFLDFNDAFMRMLGFRTRAQLLATDIARDLYVDPGERARYRRLVEETGRVTDFEFNIRKPSGEVVTLSETSFVIRDPEGRSLQYQGIVVDVTERKRAEEEIRRRNRELSTLNAIGEALSQSLDLDDILPRVLNQVVSLFMMETGAIYLLDEASGTLERKAILGFESKFRDYFPPTMLPQELIKRLEKTHTTLLTTRDLPYLPPVFSEIVAAESLHSVYLILLWSKEKIVGGMAVSSRSPRKFSDADMNLLAAVGKQVATAIENIRLYEETRRAYDDLRRAQEQLLQSEKMAAVGQLISGVAHELNNPLTAILGYSQLLEGNPEVGPRAGEYVSKLGKQAHRTHRIVQNLLSFARQNKPERRLIDINRIIEDTLTLREYDMKLNNIHIHRELRPLPATSADSHQLQQVFLNILNNACDAIAEVAASGTIQVGSWRSENTIFVEFADDGPGLKDPTRVFDPFYTTKAVGKGTGLGLSICYGIVKEHGGEIVAENRKPHGAVFRVWLPILTGVESRRTESERPPAVARGYRILLVDDEQVVLDLEREILTKHQFDVVTVRTGSEAIEHLRGGLFDLVVADLKMPGGIAGRELYSWIRENRPELTGRIMFTMSDPDEEATRTLLRESANAHVAKPFSIEEFLRVVRQALAATLPSGIR